MQPCAGCSHIKNHCPTRPISKSVSGRFRGSPMKRACILLLLVIVMAGAAALGLARGGGGHQPINIAFLGFTNVYQFDRPVAMFVATNRNSRPLRYAAHVERKTGDSWPVYFGPLPHNESPFITVPAGREFTLFKPRPAGDAPWRISMVYGFDDTAWGTARWRVAEFFYRHNWQTAGRLIHEGAKGYIAVSPEIRNDQPPSPAPHSTTKLSR
jgi:hypothetical protein